jgi:hypothetical protein
MPGKNDPLTHEEMSAAAEKFVELFSIVQAKVPEATVEDALKIMESCAKLAHKDRAEKIKKEADERFGFVKVTEEKDDSDS